jgi:hypothetical protein
MDHHDGRGSGGGNHGSVDGLDLVDDDDVAPNRESVILEPSRPLQIIPLNELHAAKGTIRCEETAGLDATDVGRLLIIHLIDEAE